jgi:hypothetical protein
MRSLNLDTSVYSFGYVAGWAEGGEQAIAGIKGSYELELGISDVARLRYSLSGRLSVAAPLAAWSTQR